MVKEGEIRKPKPLPVFDEPPFALPPSWRWSRMREITSDRGQKVPDTTFTYIDVTVINKEAGVVTGAKVLEANNAPSRARKITKKGDVIYLSSPVRLDTFFLNNLGHFSCQSCRA